MTKSAGDTETFTTAHQIEDWHDLNAVREDLEANYVLMNDLTPETTGYEGIGDDWTPIEGFFEGKLNGNHHKIVGLEIKLEEQYRVGLFEAVNPVALVTQLHLRDVDISTGGTVFGAEVGGICGLHSTPPMTITKCSVTGYLEANHEDGMVGGIVGANKGAVKNCWSDVELKGGVLGGIAGENSYGSVKNCYTLGKEFEVVGEGVAGGIVGDNSNGEVIDSICKYESPIGIGDGTQTGRVTSAPEEDMKNIDLYTENGFKDYDNLNEAWDIEETNNRSDEIWYIHNTYYYPKLGSHEYYFLEIIIEGDGITVPEEGVHKYDIDEVVEVNVFEELIDTPSYIETRLLDNLPEFYNKAKTDPNFDVWYKKFENYWIEHSREKEIEIVMDENKTFKAVFETEQSNFNALMESIGKEIEEYMIVLQDVLEAHFVDEAEDKQLDEIGQMWGLRRTPNETDTSFRERIKAYAPGFGGGGTFDDLNRTLKWYVGEDNFYIEEFDEEIQPDNRVEKVDAVEEKIGDDAVWENGDEIKFYYKPENINTIASVKNSNEENVTFTVNYEDGIITLDENVEDRFVYIEYEFNELTQYGRFKIFIDPTKDTLVSIDRIKFEIDKYKAGGIIVEFGALEFPTEDETISVDEDENIEGHMVDVTFVDDANLVLEDD